MKLLLLLLPTLLLANVAMADVVDDMLKDFTTQGAGPYSAEAGKAFFDAEHKDPQTGQMRSCSSCHTDDLKHAGRHIITGTEIEPLSPSANPGRLTDRKKIQRWLGRYCPFVLGRQCTPQEKGDALTMIRGS